MKKIEAVVQPFKMEEVKEALKNIGVDGMTISEVRGQGRQKGHREVYRGRKYNVDLLPKVKLELIVPWARIAEVLDVIVTSVQPGKIGDGEIIVCDVAETSSMASKWKRHEASQFVCQVFRQKASG